MKFYKNGALYSKMLRGAIKVNLPTEVAEDLEFEAKTRALVEKVMIWMMVDLRIDVSNFVKCGGDLPEIPRFNTLEEYISYFIPKVKEIHIKWNSYWWELSDKLEKLEILWNYSEICDKIHSFQEEFNKIFGISYHCYGDKYDKMWSEVVNYLDGNRSVNWILNVKMPGFFSTNHINYIMSGFDRELSGIDKIWSLGKILDHVQAGDVCLFGEKFRQISSINRNENQKMYEIVFMDGVTHKCFVWDIPLTVYEKSI